MTASGEGGRSRKLTWLVFLVFFLISILTNIMGPLIPEIIRGFRVSLAAAGLLPFVFFLAYGLVSIPAGIVMERTSVKTVVIGALVLEVAGALLLPLRPTYATALASFLVVGTGAAALQVVINPLLRIAGGEEHYAFNSALAQFTFGTGSFLGPLLYSYLVLRVGQESGGSFWLDPLRALTPAGLPWIAIFWVMAPAGLVVLAVTAAVRLPRRIHGEEGAGAWANYRRLLGLPLVWLYFATMFLYVGLEQGLANWISQFLFTYHRFDPRTTGALAVSWFWGSLTLGCLAGGALLKLFDSRAVLIGTTLGATAAFTAAIAGPASVSLVAFPVSGLFLSVMWPIMISLGLNSLDHSHGVFAGILCTAIVGGAAFPPVIGHLGDLLGLRAGMLVLYLSLGWVLSVGFWAKPLIRNATLRGREEADA
ncbi:MAG TPA: MFS transporter [Bryobacteraceae bacterium]|nr:MFS transporter [Bryobacteraceae bacterium]